MNLPEKNEIRCKARQRYAEDSDDDIEVDDNAEINDSEDGYWVQAWVYVPKELIK